MCQCDCPGIFSNRTNQAVFENSELAAQHAKNTAIGRNGNLEDLVGPLLFLASDASIYVTGQVLAVDGDIQQNEGTGLHRHDAVEILDMPLVETQQGQVCIDVHQCGICGSDMHAWHGLMSAESRPLFWGMRR